MAFDGKERRESARVAGRGGAEIVVLGHAGQAIARSGGLDVLDVSGGGLGLATKHPCCVGAKLAVHTEAAPEAPIRVEVVSRSEMPEGLTRLGCRLSCGRVPASLMSDW